MLLIISFLIFFYTVYKARRINEYYWLMPATVFSFILLLGQIEYFYMYNFPVSDFVRIGDFHYDFNSKVYIFHQILMGVCLISVLRIKSNNRNHSKISLNTVSLFPRIKNFKVFFFYYYFIFLVLLVLVIVHVSEINWDLLLLNNSYHLLKDADQLGLSIVARITHYLAGILSIVVGAFAIALYRNKLPMLATTLVPFVLYFLILKVAANSRWGPLIIVSMIPFLYQPKSFKSKLLMVGMGFLALGLYLGALFGRGAFNGQGVLPMVDNIVSGFQYIGYYFPKIVATAFSSSWSFDLALQVYDQTDVSFDVKYKVLAFSPFISSLDGYDELAKHNIIKIHTYAPVNFITELYFFGMGYMFFAFLFIWYVLKKANILFIKFGIISILPCATLYLFFFKMQQYPVRNSFRFLFITLFAIFIYERIMKRKTNK